MVFRRHTSTRLAFLALIVATGLPMLSCSPNRLSSHEVKLRLPPLPTKLSREVLIPARRRYQRVPLVVLLDNGPPVNPNYHKPADERVAELTAAIRSEGYAVWRPLRDAWSRDRFQLRPLDELVSQVRLGLAARRQIPELDTAGVIVVGVGSGGVVGSVVAARSRNDVRALALISTPARSVDQILASRSWRDSVVTRRLRRRFDGIWSGAYADTVLVLGAPASCWRSWLTVTDEMEALVSGLSQPTLVLQGSADKMIPLIDIERYRRAIGTRPNSSTKTLVGVTHGLKDKLPDPLEDPDRLSPRVRNSLFNWLRKTAPSPATPVRR
jgi:alpha-beta hydrolase superfamily lysophospholipase